MELAVGATIHRPTKRRTRTNPRQPPTPSPSRARNVPSTDRQRSRGWWSRRGKKGAFLWRLDTVSLGKHQRNGVERQDKPKTTAQRIGAHAQTQRKGEPLICAFYVCAVLLGNRPRWPCPFHPISLLLRKETGWSPKETRLRVPPRELLGPARLSHGLEAPTSPPTASG